MRWSIVFAVLLAGCGSPFKDESDELAYLSSLRDPTPEQWVRRRELEKPREDALRHQWQAQNVAANLADAYRKNSERDRKLAEIKQRIKDEANRPDYQVYWETQLIPYLPKSERDAALEAARKRWAEVYTDGTRFPTIKFED